MEFRYFYEEIAHLVIFGQLFYLEGEAFIKEVAWEGSLYFGSISKFLGPTQSFVSFLFVQYAPKAFRKIFPLHSNSYSCLRLISKVC